MDSLGNYHRSITTKVRHSQDVYQKLKNIHANRNNTIDCITEFVQKIFSEIRDFFRGSCFYSLTKEHYCTLMIQENLHTQGWQRGSANYPVKQMFLKYIQRKESATFKDLQKGIENMTTLDGNIFYSLLPFGKTCLVSNLMEQYESLSPGESMWIDLSTYSGQHSMKGRIVKKENNQFVFQMSNTGAGVSNREAWHKKQSHYHQVVLEWGPLDEKALTHEFFEEMLNATVNGQSPKGTIPKEIDGKAANNEDLAAVDTIYQVLEKHIGQPRNDISIETHRNYFSNLQFGPSCTPMSFWALIRVILNDTEYSDMQKDISLRYLKSMYKQIISGEDRSQYIHIKALELVDSLLDNFVINKKPPPPILKDMRVEIARRTEDLGGKQSIELINEQPFTMPEDGYATIRWGKLDPISGALKAQVTFQEPEDKPIRIKIQKDEKGEPTGLITLAYLLYESILNDDEADIKLKTDAFFKFINSKDSPLHCWSKKDNLYESSKQLNYLIQFFYNLSCDLQRVDGTQFSRPKQNVIVEIAYALQIVHYASFCVDKADFDALDLDVYDPLQEARNQSLDFVAGLATNKFTAGSDNDWFRKRTPDKFLKQWVPYSDRLRLHAELIRNPIAPKVKNFEVLDPIISGEVPLIGYSFEEPNSTGSIPITKNSYIKNPSTVFIKENGDGGFISPTLAGNLYLLYSMIVTNQQSTEKFTDDLGELFTCLKEQEITLDEIPNILTVLGFITSYCVNLRNLDPKHPENRSPEALCYAQLLVTTAKSLLKRVDHLLEESHNPDFEIHLRNQCKNAINPEYEYFQILSPFTYFYPKNYRSRKDLPPHAQRMYDLYTLL